MLIAIFGLLLTLQVNGEYSIRNGSPIPTYMYKIFKNIKDPIFPGRLVINLSLSKITGILLYTIDRRHNQLIMMLDDLTKQKLKIKFGTTQKSVPLFDLCGCSDCRYTNLSLVIEIDKSLSIKCNSGKTETIEYITTDKFYGGFPTPYNISDISKDTLNEAHLWLVNTPMPDNDQLSGCIFSVLHYNESVIFTNVTVNVERKCVRACVDNICNGGECYETYDVTPVCNCKRTFQNGVNCNDSIPSKNLLDINESLIFEKFKLSLKPSSGEVMSLINKFVHIRIKTNENRISLEYTVVNGSRFKTERYDVTMHEDNKTVLIVQFKVTEIQCELYNNYSWSTFVVEVDRDLRDVIFDSINFTHVSDFVYTRLTNEFKWPQLVANQPYKNETDIDNCSCTIFKILFGFFFIISLFFVIPMAWKWIRKKFGRKGNPRESQNQPPMGLDVLTPLNPNEPSAAPATGEVA